jgi:hypothetical protein
MTPIKAPPPLTSQSKNPSSLPRGVQGKATLLAEWLRSAETWDKKFGRHSALCNTCLGTATEASWEVRKPSGSSSLPWENISRILEVLIITMGILYRPRYLEKMSQLWVHRPRYSVSCLSRILSFLYISSCYSRMRGLWWSETSSKPGHGQSLSGRLNRAKSC